MTGKPLVSHTIIQVHKGSRNPDSGAGRMPWIKGLTGLLALLFLLFLARMVLVLFILDPAPNNGSISLMTATDRPEIDIDRLRTGQLFGTRNTASAPVEQNLQAASNNSPVTNETALNLRLDGVIVGNSPSQGLAMIASNSNSGSYRIGDRLPVGNRVILDQIYPDRVILENNGRLETLQLYEEGTGAAAPSVTSSALSIDQQTLLQSGANNAGSSGTSFNPHALVNEYQERFQGNALAADFLTLSEIVQISPEYNNSQLLGYRLSPGEYLKEFIRLGFKTNDIVTRLNNIELNNIANLPDLVETMSTAETITVSLIRDGVPSDLEVSLAELSK